METRERLNRVLIKLLPKIMQPLPYHVMQNSTLLKVLKALTGQKENPLEFVEVYRSSKFKKHSKFVPEENVPHEFIHLKPEERKKPFIRYLPFSFEALARFKFLILIFDQTVHP